MEQIEDCISFLVGKAAQGVGKRTRAALAPFGVTPVQYAALWVLWAHDGLRATDLGARLVLDSATTTGLVDRLEASGFIERRPHPSDRRVHCLYLTSDGRALQGPLDATMDALNDSISEELGGDAATTWAGLAKLGRIRDSHND